MKKTLSLMGVLLLIVIVACKRDYFTATEKPRNQTVFLEEAKHYYNKVRGTVTKKAAVNGTLSANRGIPQLTPYWDKARVVAGRNTSAELPVSAKRKRVAMFSFAHTAKPTRAQNQLRFRAAFQRALIYKKPNGKIRGIMLTYLPDYQYLQTHSKRQTYANRITKLAPDFTGYISYASLKTGKNFQVLYVDRGRVVKKLYAKSYLAKRKKAAPTKSPQMAKVMSEGDGCGEEPPVYEGDCEEEGGEEESCEEDCDGDGGEWGGGGEGGDCEGGEEGGGEEECYEEDEEEGEEEYEDCEDEYWVCEEDWEETDCEDPATEDCEEAKNPCDEAEELNEVMDQLQSYYDDLKNTPDTAEYGMEEKLSNFPPDSTTTYNAPNIRSTGETSFEPDFTWDSTDGYTIGFGHTHPDDRGPSPSDILTPASFSGKSNLVNSHPAALQYYKANMRVVTTTPNHTYIVTIANWEALKTRTKNKSKAQLDNLYWLHSQDYLNGNSSASLAEQTEYALMEIFGSSINVYKKNPTTGRFEPYEKGPFGGLRKIDCPND